MQEATVIRRQLVARYVQLETEAVCFRAYFYDPDPPERIIGPSFIQRTMLSQDVAQDSGDPHRFATFAALDAPPFPFHARIMKEGSKGRRTCQ